MKAIKNGTSTLQKLDRKDNQIKNNAINGYKIDRRKKKGKFDKNYISETDMDEILAIG